MKGGGINSKKARHHIGVPEQGVGTTKERKMARKGRAAKKAMPLCCEKPIQYVRLVQSSGRHSSMKMCSVCQKVWR